MLKINMSNFDKVPINDFAKMEESPKDEVAIIGMAVYYPDADNTDEFWENLKNAKSSVGEFPQNRKQDMDRYLSRYHPEAYSGRYEVGSYLKEVDKFDYNFFQMSPREAELSDPNQRLFLQTTYHAIEDAGYGGDRLRGSKTGVFFGFNADSLMPYRNLIGDTQPDSLAMAVPGNLTAVIPGRVSYFLDLKGPSISVDTACSSSLTAVHLACRSLENGDCSMAIAGSSKLNLAPLTRTQKLGIESGDGITRTFDDSSDGTGSGEGVVAIVLKPLSRAVKDGDQIYAVIMASACNQDGSSMAITAPNVSAQEQVILRAWKNAGIHPETIAYIEAHGTGTKLGDPIEIAGITQAFSQYTNRKGFCAIGSLKTNLGHLDHAAGLAGLSKAVLALKNAQIPAHLHFKSPNKEIDFPNTPVYVNTSLRDWKSEGYPRRCGVSAFGLSGTNCHIILEEAPAERERRSSAGAHIVTLSAKSKEALEALAEAYQSFLFSEKDGIDKIAYTSNVGRGHYPYRIAVLVQDIKELKEKMASLQKSCHTMEENGIFYGEVSRTNRTKTINPERLSLRELARLYTEGEEIAWDALYAPDRPGITRLPLYPFEKARCWIKLPETDIQYEAVEPWGREDGTYSVMEHFLAQVFGKVLGFERINLFDGFYELGGDSISAMEMVGIINEKLNMSIHIADILACVGIADLAAVLEDAVSEEVMEALTKKTGFLNQNQISSGREEEKAGDIIYMEASSAQKRMYLMGQEAEVRRSYQIVSVMEIMGQIDGKRAESVFRQLIGRHEALRTSFEVIDGEIMQVIHPEVNFVMEIVEKEDRNQDTAVSSFLEEFDLGKAPLFRTGLVKTEENRYLFIFCADHLIADGSSVSIINSEFIRLYVGETLPALCLSYRDYTVWQKSLFRSAEYKTMEKYWCRTLSGELPLLALPTDYPRASAHNTKGATDTFSIPRTLADSLASLGASSGASLYMVLFAAYNVFLYRYTGQEDIIIGSSIAGRDNSRFDHVAGMFVNTLAIRSFPEGHKPFSLFLTEIRQILLQAYKHENYQFEDLTKVLSITREAGRNPLFDTMFVLQNQRRERLQMENITIRPYEWNRDTSRFDLLLNAIPDADGILFEMEYATSLFRKETIQRMAEHFKRLLEQIVQQPDRPLLKIPMLPEEERGEWLYGRQVKKDYPLHRSLISLFQEQVSLHGHKTAVVSKGNISNENNTLSDSLTYKELDRRSGYFAALLKEQGLKKGDIAAVFTERSIDSIIAILAVLKAGGAYLPIESNLPQERIRYLLADSGTGILLTREALAEKAEGFGGKVILLHEEIPESFGKEEPELTSTEELQGRDLAYVLYTSGSTGQPKGVMVEHGNVVNFLYSLREQYGGKKDDRERVLSTTSLSFDVSVAELFLALCFGGELHFYRTGGIFDSREAAAYIISEKITFCYIPPAVLTDVSRHLRAFGKNVNLNKMLVGVEPIKDYVLADYLSLNPDMIIINGYGPTEATICAAFYRYEQSGDGNRTVPIGKALTNDRIYLLDREKNPVPQGVTGEIYISGAGLARGYLNLDGLTAEKFLDNPFEPGTRMYQTGDLAKWLPDGNLQFLGRADYQVKIRGYRIEPGEIENKLLEIEEIEQAVVTDWEDESGIKYLCAYVTGQTPVEPAKLRLQLKDKLPSYMVPSYICQIASIPLTGNGKTDKKALPKPEIMLSAEYVMLYGETQEKLGEIWSELLGVEIEKIGADDDFFDLGGHSLKAAKLTYRIQECFGVTIPLAKVFELTTIRMLAQYMETQEQKGFDYIKKAEEKEYYALSSAQMRIFLHHRMGSGTTSYNMTSCIRMSGELERERLEKAFRLLIVRHEALRTGFFMVGEEPVQKIMPADETVFRIDYLEAEEADIQSLEEGFRRPFDLEKAPLLRAGLVTTGIKEHILLLDMHHIISDGASVGIITKELLQLYEGQELAQAGMQYKDFSEWQVKQYQEGKLKQQEEYWLDIFKDEIPVLSLPTDHKRPEIQSFEGASVSFAIEGEQYRRLKTYVKESSITLHMLLLSAFSILLSRYSGQEDIVIGVPSEGRAHNELAQVVGMFVNTLPVRSYPSSAKRMDAFIKEMKESLLRAYETQLYPMEALVEKAVTTRDLSRNPLYDVMFVLQNNDRPNIGLREIDFSFPEIPVTAAKVDLTLNVLENDHNLGCSLDYSTALFQPESIKRMICHYMRILEEMVSNPRRQIRECSLMTHREEVRLLEEFAGTGKDYPFRSMAELFEGQVRKTPLQIAFVCDGKEITYRQLNEKANFLAKKLTAEGICPGSFIGIMTGQDITLAIGILAILKAGGVYVPLSPKLNRERLEYMIKDSGIRLLLQAEGFPDYPVPAMILPSWEEIEEEPDNPGIPVSAGDLAYMIYTSGTTGTPKGVLIEHGGLAANVQWNAQDLCFGTNITVLPTFHYSFDGFVLFFFSAIITGARTVMLGSLEAFDIPGVLHLIFAGGVTDIASVPALYEELIERMDGETAGRIRSVTVAGESITPRIIEETRRKNKDIQLINAYGPTESTVVAAVEHGPKADCITIGKPILNTRIYILDREHRLMPVGVVGEIYISGAGLARGYLNRSGLTAERFIDNPYEPESRMYKTGDMGRWLSDGRIQFMGRSDDQVKIRGYRIEPGEIEAKLLETEGVERAVVIDREDESGIKYLCAYVTGPVKIEPSKVRLQLKDRLPSYMIPAYICQMETIPLTANGKIDKKALPKPPREGTGETEYVELSGEMQEKLGLLWKELLALETIGANDNFFELGGHSLKAARLTYRIKEIMHVDVPLAAIFEYPTIVQLAGYLKAQEQTDYKAIGRAEEKDYYGLSSAQKKMYLLNRMNTETTAYNMPTVIEITGGLEAERLKQAWEGLLARHEALRTAFCMMGENPVQKILSMEEIRPEFTYQECGGSAEAISVLAAGFIRPFDLEQAPLMRMLLARMPGAEPKHLLLIDMHHIISDGATLSLIVNELTALYRQEELPALTIQYKDFSEWQQKQKNEKKWQQAGKYWREIFADEIPVLNLPVDYERPQIQTFEGTALTVRMQEGLCRRLTGYARANGVTLHMILMAGFAILLSKYSGQEDIVIGTPAAGRIHNELAHVAGMFVNTLPIRSNPSPDKEIRIFLEEMKQELLSSYEHQLYPMETLVEEVAEQRDMSRNPLYDVMLAMQNNDHQEIAADGISFRMKQPEIKSAKMDIALSVSEEENGLSFLAEYSTSLFKEESIKRMLGHYMKVLEEMVSDPRQQIKQCSLMTREEEIRLLEEFAGTRKDYPFLSMVELFERQVKKTPLQIAFVCDEKEITYQKLNEKANFLAKKLIEEDIPPESFIGIMTGQDITLAIGILAILKAGGVYVPLSPQLNRERLEYMIKDGGIRLLLQAEGLPDYPVPAMILPGWEEMGEEPDNLGIRVSASDLAYVIYTSGTTGTPKGVLIEHGGLSANVQWHGEDLGLGPEVTLLQTFHYAFDGFILHFFSAITTGVKTVMPGSLSVADIPGILDIIRMQKVTDIAAVPVLYGELIAGMDEKTAKTVRSVTVAGESLAPRVIRETKRKNRDIQLVNSYGPTESTVIATSEHGPEEECITIGKPIPNTRIYILDSEHRLVPVGVIGEIYIGGAGLARGYQNRSDLTAERFIDNPYEPESRMYKTGDLGRWLSDGRIQFMGRADDQVKIRGYRIEPGEIEAKLLEIEGIEKAVVIDREDENGTKYLCAYLVFSADQKTAQIRSGLKKKLPAYMIPAYFIRMEQIPLTANGKINRKMLPLHDGNTETGEEYLAPENEIQEILVLVWKSVLHASKVGIMDDFFGLGGDSLKSVKVVAELGKYGYTVGVRDVIEAQSIRELSEKVKRISEDTVETVEGYAPLTPTQADYFRYYRHEELHIWNIATLIYKTGGFQEVFLRQALDRIVWQHDVLRMVLPVAEENGKSVRRQYYRGKDAESFYGFYCFDMTGEEDYREHITREAEQIQGLNDLESGPLMQIALFKTKDKDYLLFVIHHIICDFLSMNILMEDFWHIYMHYEAGMDMELPRKTASFMAWSRSMYRAAHSREILAVLGYWLHIAQMPVRPLPTDYICEKRIQKDLLTAVKKISAAETSKVIDSIQAEHQASADVILLTILGRAIKKWCGNTLVRVDWAANGRNDTYDGLDITRTVGWFTTAYPVLIDSSAEESGADLQKVKEALYGMPGKVTDYYLLRDITLPEKYVDISLYAPKEVYVNYLGYVASADFGEEMQEVFGFSDIPVGENTSKEADTGHKLAVLMSVTEGELCLTVRFVSTEYKKESIENLLDLYAEEFTGFSERGT